MNDSFEDIYRDKNVLVTGHTGFKGSWLALWLNELGANVIGYALDPRTEKDNFVVTGLSNEVIDIRGDIRDFEKLFSILRIYRPQFVFHLAAQPLVRLSYEKPRETYETNVLGTVNLLETVRLVDSVKVVVIISSDKCYQNREMIWGYREEDRVGGFDPYSSSKGCVELITSAYRNSFFNRPGKTGPGLASVRAGNVIGGGDWAEDRIIPDCIRSLTAGKEIEIRNPGAIRPWQHVLEPLQGYLLLGAKLLDRPEEYQGAWNFGPDEGLIITVQDLVEKVIGCWGSGGWKDVSTETRPHEARLLKLDISKARYYLGWNPGLDIDETVRLTVDWYKSEQPSYQLARQQIEEYQSYCQEKSLR